MYVLQHKTYNQVESTPALKTGQPLSVDPLTVTDGRTRSWGPACEWQMPNHQCSCCCCVVVTPLSALFLSCMCGIFQPFSLWTFENSDFSGKLAVQKRAIILAKSILKMPNQCYCVLQLSEARSSQHNRSCDYNADNRTTLTFLENPAIAKQFCLRFWQLGVIMWCWAVGTFL